MAKLIFITKTGKKYHNALADNYIRHSVRNTQWNIFANEKKAQEAGYTPCKICIQR